MKFAVKFEGKLKDTEGIYYPITAECNADSAALAVLALYDRYVVIEVHEITYLDHEHGVSQALCEHIIGEVLGDEHQLSVVTQADLAGRELFYPYLFCPDCGVKLN